MVVNFDITFRRMREKPWGPEEFKELDLVKKKRIAFYVYLVVS